MFRYWTYRDACFDICFFLREPSIDKEWENIVLLVCLPIKRVRFPRMRLLYIAFFSELILLTSSKISKFLEYWNSPEWSKSCLRSLRKCHGLWVLIKDPGKVDSLMSSCFAPRSSSKDNWAFVPVFLFLQAFKQNYELLFKLLTNWGSGLHEKTLPGTELRERKQLHIKLLHMCNQWRGRRLCNTVISFSTEFACLCRRLISF